VSEELRPYDPQSIGEHVLFLAEDGRYKHGKIIAPEYVAGEFIGYTVWSESEQVNYVRVKQRRGGEWQMIPVKLT
jgi:hypothetical protein